MSVIIPSYIFAILFEIVYPILVGIWVIRRYRTGWKIFGAGVLTFLGSQIVHLLLLSGLTALIQKGLFPSPAQQILPYAAMLGLLAGLCEETARFSGFKILRDKANSWEGALTLGAGHGGTESILIGLASLANFALIMYIHLTGQTVLGTTPDQALKVLDLPWTLPLASAVERLTMLILQITLSVMVWLAASRRAWLWFAAAILWHALVDGSVLLLQSVGLTAWEIEGILAGIMLINLTGLYIMSLVYKGITLSEPDRTNVL